MAPSAAATEMIECGGALAAFGEIDPATAGASSKPEGKTVEKILTMLEKEQGQGGGAGLRALTEVRDRYKANPSGLATTASACAKQYGE